MIILGGLGRSGFVYSFGQAAGEACSATKKITNRAWRAQSLPVLNELLAEQSSVRLGHGWQTDGMRKYFIGTRHSLHSQFIYIYIYVYLFIYMYTFCPTTVYILRKTCVCVCVYVYVYVYIYIHIYSHTYLTPYRLYMNYRCYQIALQ